MTSTTQSALPLPGVRGLVFLGFPLHAPGRPGIERGEHLDGVRVPMLFLQGTRDEFAQLDLLQSVTTRLNERATLHLVEGGDHSFKVSKSADQAYVCASVQQAIADWIIGRVDA